MTFLFLFLLLIWLVCFMNCPFQTSSSTDLYSVSESPVLRAHVLTTSRSLQLGDTFGNQRRDKGKGNSALTGTHRPSCKGAVGKNHTGGGGA